MGFIPRRRIIENLNTTQVFVQDTQNEYFIVQDIPDTFVQGRSAFKVFGSQFLKKDVPLKIEILDKSGNTVYVQPVKYGQGISPKLPYRYISVEVYPPPFNVPGEAELVILGELDETKVPFNIPSEFIGTYNVRYSKKVNIDTATVINTQPILFYKKPTVAATATTVAQKKSDPPANAFVAGTNLYGFVNAELKGKRFETGSAVNTQENFDDGGKSDTPSGDVKTETNLWKYKSGLYSKRTVLTRRGMSEERLSPEPPQMTLYSVTPAFNSKMVGGEITVTDIKLTDNEKRNLSGLQGEGAGAGASGYPQGAVNSMFTLPTYKARVEEVISDRKLTTSKPYSVKFNGPNSTSEGEKIYSDIGSPSLSDNIYASYSASYLDWAVPSTSSYRFDTIVDLDVSNLRTFSGDVYRMKVYGASDSAQGEFPVLLDTIVESPETLVDNDVLKFPLRTGYFLDQDHIDKYWNSFGGDNNTGTINTVSTSSVYVDGLYISGSYRGYNEVGRFELDQDYAFTVKKDIPYTISFQATAKKTEKVVNSGGMVESYAKLMIHLSGSNLSGDNRLSITHASSFGQSLTNSANQKVGLELKTDEPYSDYDFPRVSHTFFPKFKSDKIKNEDTIVQFRIESGEWYISDVSLKPARDTGFSPDEMKIRIPLPPNTQRPDNYDFFLEYYDINGNTAEATTFVNNVGISGSALVVEGGDNLLTGSLFIGNLQGQGIEMAGANSAYMRSIGYDGFVSASAGQGGFMIFSGSVLPDAPDDYAGAGLEIHDGTVGDDESFFKFRTNPSEFRVKTDSFFFGNKTSGQFISGSNGNLVMSSSRFFLGGDSSFISGSNGNIEITSSNFHLQPDGDVVMQGTITAEAGGTIGGWDITSDAISDLNPSGKGIEIKSDPSTPIITIKEDSNNKIELFHTTTSNFGVKGVVSGNNVFQLGSTNQIAGWTFDNSTISSNNLIIDSSGELRTNDYDPQFAGWIITPKANGFAEFENIRIRGTLRTTTFEKETVNAVGGQVWVANSTAVSKSVAAADDVIVVENSSGFAIGEVIFAKKVSAQGFTKEFMTITSMSREDASSDTNMVGSLFVDRGTNELSSSFTSSITNLDGAISDVQTELTVDDNAVELDKSIIKVDFEYMKVTGSRGTTKIQVLRGADGSQKVAHSDNAVVGQLSRDAAMVASFLSPRETYTPGQVLVSTGRYIGGEGTNTTGSGYMLLNANPTTGDTPFMDFAERTGSGVYDVKLKTRLGDLSGLMKSRFGREVGISDNPGFGLASENVFLSGMIRANSGSIGGISMGSEKIFTEGGGSAHGDTDTGFFASASGDFSLKDKVIFTAGSSNLSLKPNTFELDASNVEISSTHASMSLGEGKIKLIGASTSTITVGAANSLTLSDDGTDRFLVVGSKSSFSHFDQSTAGIILGTDNGTTKFEVVGDEDNYISFNGSSFDIKSETFDLATTNLLVESSTPQIRVGGASSQRVTLASSTLTFHNSSNTEVLSLKNSMSKTINIAQSGLGGGGNTTFTSDGGIEFAQAGAIFINGTASGTFADVFLGPNHFIHQTNNQDEDYSFSLGNYLDDNFGDNKNVHGVQLFAYQGGAMTGSDRIIEATHISSRYNQSLAALHASAQIKGLTVELMESSFAHASGRAKGIHVDMKAKDTGSNYGIYVDFTSQETALGSEDVVASGYGVYSTAKMASEKDIIAFVSSDERLKTNIKPITGSLDKVLDIDGVSFEWKDGYDDRVQNKTNLGIIAQDVEKVIPEIVKERKDGYLAVQYDQLIPVLIESIKDQQKQIDELKKILDRMFI